MHKNESLPEGCLMLRRYGQTAGLVALLCAACGLPAHPTSAAKKPTAPTDSSPAQDSNITARPANPNEAEPTVDPNLAKLDTLDSVTKLAGGPYYFGRFVQDANGATFAWPGSSIFARFTGTGISAVIEELNAQVSYSGSAPQGNDYDVIIDGADPNPLATQPGLMTYVLAQNLKSGEHTLLLRKRTEALVGVARFKGFTVQGGQPLAAPSPVPEIRRIEILGDSISCGYGVDGLSSTCHFSPATENVGQSYGYLTAQELKAEVHIAAWSGKGVSRNDDGSTTDTLPILYNRTLPTDPNSVWDFSTWTPQVVVINLATNDFAKGVPYGLSFEGAYATLLASVRMHYPQALIFCALGPMLSDAYPPGESHLTTARTYIQSVVNGSQDPHIYFIEFPVQGPQTGCDYHPSPTTQLSMSAQLVTAIRAKTGWQ
jgi:hypothetical protein